MTDTRFVLIIPAYNEEASIERVLADVARVQLDCEIVVIDDGSHDATAAIAQRTGATVIRHPFNLGYGSALQTGYKYALQVGASFLAQMDADGQHDPRELTKLAEPVLAGDCDLVVGSRFLETTGYQMGILRSAAREFFRLLALLAGLRVSDPTSGLQVMNRTVLEVYASDFFPVDYPDVNVLLAVYRHGLSVEERSVSMSEAARKSTLHGGLRSLYYVYKMLLSTWSSAAASRRRPKSGQGDRP